MFNSVFNRFRPVSSRVLKTYTGVGFAGLLEAGSKGLGFGLLGLTTSMKHDETYEQMIKNVRNQ